MGVKGFDTVKKTKNSMRGCLPTEKLTKIIIGNSMVEYARKQLSGVTQTVAKSNTMVAV